MPLQPRLDEITQNTRNLVLADRLAVSEQLTADLFSTGIEDAALPVGSKAPAFLTRAIYRPVSCPSEINDSPADPSPPAPVQNPFGPA